MILFAPARRKRNSQSGAEWVFTAAVVRRAARVRELAPRTGRLRGSAHELWYRPVAPSAPPGHRAPAPNVHQQPAKTNRLHAAAAAHSKTNYSLSPKGEIVFAPPLPPGQIAFSFDTDTHGTRVLPWRLLIRDPRGVCSYHPKRASTLASIGESH